MRTAVGFNASRYFRTFEGPARVAIRHRRVPLGGSVNERGAGSLVCSNAVLGRELHPARHG
jgi:hypothetical protein